MLKFTSHNKIKIMLVLLATKIHILTLDSTVSVNFSGLAR